MLARASFSVRTTAFFPIGISNIAAVLRQDISRRTDARHNANASVENAGCNQRTSDLRAIAQEWTPDPMQMQVLKKRRGCNQGASDLRAIALPFLEDDSSVSAEIRARSQGSS